MRVLSRTHRLPVDAHHGHGAPGLHGLPRRRCRNSTAFWNKIRATHLMIRPRRKLTRSRALPACGRARRILSVLIPIGCFITCSDSRIVPDLILGTGPGDLFITRNAGNVIPVTANDVDGCTATIEYAVEVLKVKHAILCGHSDCGAMKAALDPSGLEQTAQGQPLAAPRGRGVQPSSAPQPRRW